MKSLALLVLASGVARADDVGYATLDRQDDTSKLGAAISYLDIKGYGQFGRLDLSGQFVNSTVGAGFYVQVPVAFESDTSTNTTVSLGGLEVGGIFASPSGTVLHAGLVLPTADVTGQALLSSSLARTVDLAQALPDATILRGGASYSFRACQIFGRIEISLDVPISTGNTTTAFDGQILHVDAALGLDAEAFTLTLETTNLFGIGTMSPSFADVATAVRFRAGDARPYLAAVIPLDNQLNEPRIAVIAGVEIRFSRPR